MVNHSCVSPHSQTASRVNAQGMVGMGMVDSRMNRTICRSGVGWFTLTVWCERIRGFGRERCTHKPIFGIKQALHSKFLLATIGEHGVELAGEVANGLGYGLEGRRKVLVGEVSKFGG